MDHRRRATLAAIVLSLALASAAQANNRVLVIGIDGAGGRFLRDANTPNIDALIANGAVHYEYLNEGALVPNPPRATAPAASIGRRSPPAPPPRITAWSTTASPAATTTSTRISSSTSRTTTPRCSPRRSSIGGRSTTRSCRTNRRSGDCRTSATTPCATRPSICCKRAIPTRSFCTSTRSTPRGTAFGWGTPQYYTAIQNVDGLIGNVMAALNARPGVVGGSENWLVLVTADHGGEGTSHFASQGLDQLGSAVCDQRRQRARGDDAAARARSATWRRRPCGTWASTRSARRSTAACAGCRSARPTASWAT